MVVRRQDARAVRPPERNNPSAYRHHHAEHALQHATNQPLQATPRGRRGDNRAPSGMIQKLTICADALHNAEPSTPSTVVTIV